ncbi:MAG TPA: PAS domain-containing protein [Anaerolineaceae bacterium]|nr:PAS domain-containing protein [Anaerolineaceae bacterium]
MESAPRSQDPAAAPEWAAGFPGAVTVCDPQGIVLYLNEKSAESYAASGGLALIGKNLLDCHPEPARTRLQAMLDTQQSNVYTIEKNGVKKLIVQTPLYQGGVFTGYAELNLEIPAGELPHYIRD